VLMPVEIVLLWSGVVRSSQEFGGWNGAGLMDHDDSFVGHDSGDEGAVTESQLQMPRYVGHELDVFMSWSTGTRTSREENAGTTRTLAMRRKEYFGPGPNGSTLGLASCQRRPDLALMIFYSVVIVLTRSVKGGLYLAVRLSSSFYVLA